MEASEVCPLRATEPGRFLPASWFSQHPVAKTIVRPPATGTLCVGILPVLCNRKNDSDRRRAQNTRNSAKITNLYDRVTAVHCSGLTANSATETKVNNSRPNAMQLWRLYEPLIKRVRTPLSTQGYNQDFQFSCNVCAKSNLAAQPSGCHSASSYRCKAEQTHRRDSASEPRWLSCTRHTGGSPGAGWQAELVGEHSDRRGSVSRLVFSMLCFSQI